MARSFGASSPAGTCPVGQAACRISRVAQGGLQDTALFVPTRWQARRATQEKSTGWWLTRWKISYRITWSASFKGCRPRSPWRPAADQRSVRNSRYSICNLESPQRPASLSPEQESCRGLSGINLVTDLKLELFGVAVSCTSEEQAGLACWQLRKLFASPRTSLVEIKNRLRNLSKKVRFGATPKTSTRDACAPQPPVTYH